ncbi:uncharacterized protein [Triticum aestivum]|uniref:uncharacterized protein isoform X1 n=1 Tax=Triticum aestivum TaxID=4565 RepID=UPI001D025147|nr:uncharacterized protein LOC123046260 isoform X1 [Triticum aestivum]
MPGRGPHRGRLACLVYLRDEDVAAAVVEHIEARLASLLRGDSEASSGAVAAVPAGSIPHANRRLHHLMYASGDQEHAFPTPTVRAHGSRARHHGLRAQGALRPDLPPRQLCLRPVRRRQQLGQGPLHQGRGAHRLRPRRRPRGGRELRCLQGVPLPRRGHRFQDQGVVPGPDDAHLLRVPISKGL